MCVCVAHTFSLLRLYLFIVPRKQKEVKDFYSFRLLLPGGLKTNSARRQCDALRMADVHRMAYAVNYSCRQATVSCYDIYVDAENSQRILRETHTVVVHIAAGAMSIIMR